MIQSYMYTSVTSKHKPYLIPFRVLFQEKKIYFTPLFTLNNLQVLLKRF